MKRTLILIAISLSFAKVHAEEIRVMSFNIWHGGDAGGQPLSQTIKAIRAAKADIVGLQETHGHAANGVRRDNGQQIADVLGWNYFDQGDRTGILSRFPIEAATEKKWGVEIEYSAGKTLLFANAHFPSSPYQPYQLLNIPYGNAPFITTEAQAIEWANKSRGANVGRLLLDLEPSLKKGTPIVLTGDFNEPSFQDWTPRAVDAKLCPIEVSFPATKRVTSAGFVDAWRAVHPDEVKSPGWTWTPTTAPDDPKDKHDRIDFVFVTAAHIEVTKCERVAEPGNSEITVAPWPSDHRAVVATIEIQTPR